MHARQKVLTPGVKLMLLSALGFVGMQMIIKELAHFHVFQIVFFRSVTTSLFCIIYLKKKGISLKGNNQKVLFLRSICGIISMTLFFVTLQRMPLGASVTLKYLSPLFTAVFAFLILKEEIKHRQWLYFLGALLGVLLLKGFDVRIDTLNLILGIIGALFGGLVYVIISKIGHSEHSMVIVNYFMLSATILAGIAMLPYWQNPTTPELGLLILLGALGYVGQVFMTKAFQTEPSSRVAPVKYMEVIYSLIIGFFWFGESYGWISLLGIALVMVCMYLNLMVKVSKTS